MAVELVWDNEEKTIVRWIFSGQFTWEDYEQGSRKIEEMIEDIDHKFTTIFDLTLMTGMPQYPVSRYPKLIRDVPDKQEFLIVVSNNKMIDMFGRIFTRVYWMNIKVARNLEEAHAIIEERKHSKT